MKKSIFLILAAFVFTTAFVSNNIDSDPVKEFMKKNSDQSVEIEVFERDWLEFSNWGIRVGGKPTDMNTNDGYRKDKRLGNNNNMTLKVSFKDMMSKIFSVDVCNLQSSSSQKAFADAKTTGWVYLNIWLEGEKKSETLQSICSDVVNGYNMKGMEAITKENAMVEDGSIIYQPEKAPSGLKKLKIKLTPQ